MSRADYDAAAEARGANFVGSPQQAIDKVLHQHEIFRHDRFLVQFSVGPMPHDLDHAVDRAVRDRGRTGRPNGGRPTGRCLPSAIDGGGGMMTVGRDHRPFGHLNPAMEEAHARPLSHRPPAAI